MHHKRKKTLGAVSILFCEVVMHLNSWQSIAEMEVSKLTVALVCEKQACCIEKG